MRLCILHNLFLGYNLNFFFLFVEPYINYQFGFSSISQEIYDHTTTFSLLWNICVSGLVVKLFWIQIVNKIREKYYALPCFKRPSKREKAEQGSKPSGPAEYFQIKWGRPMRWAYSVPPDLKRVAVSAKIKWGQISTVPICTAGPCLDGNSRGCN